MNVDRPVKELLYCELAHSSRKVGRPKLRFKNTCKNALKCADVLDQWQSIVHNRAEWRSLTRKVCVAHGAKRVMAYEKKRARRRAERSRKGTVDIPVSGERC